MIEVDDDAEKVLMARPEAAEALRSIFPVLREASCTGKVVVAHDPEARRGEFPLVVVGIVADDPDKAEEAVRRAAEMYRRAASEFLRPQRLVVRFLYTLAARRK